MLCASENTAVNPRRVGGGGMGDPYLVEIKVLFYEKIFDEVLNEERKSLTNERFLVGKNLKVLINKGVLWIDYQIILKDTLADLTPSTRRGVTAVHRFQNCL